MDHTPSGHPPRTGTLAALLLLALLGLCIFRTPLESPALVSDTADFMEHDLRIRDRSLRTLLWTTPLRATEPASSRKDVWGMAPAGHDGERIRGLFYRPLALQTMAWSFDLAGAHAGLLRGTNLALHLLLVAGVLLALRRRLPLPAALAPALWLLTHPLNAETVSFVVGRMDLMAIGLSAAALALARRASGSRGALALAALLYLGACLSKESALCLAPLFLLVGRRALVAPALALPVYLLLRYEALGALLAGGSGGLLASPGALLEGLLFYLRHLLFPFDLQLFSYAPAAAAPHGGPGFLGTLLFVAALAAATRTAWCRGERARIGVALGFLLLPLAPVLNGAALPFPFADRYLYGSSLGLALLFGELLVAAPPSRRRLLAGVLVVVALVNAGFLAERNQAFASKANFWEAVLSQPHVPLLFVKAKQVLDERRAARDALEELRRSGTAVSEVEEAILLGRLDQMREALEILEALPPEHPEFVPARLHAALFRRRQQRLEEAAQNLREVLDRHPGHSGALAQLGEVRLHQGRLDEAVQRLEESAARQESAAVRFNLGLAHLRAGRLEEAERQLGRAIALAPDDPRPWGARAEVRKLRGLTGQAREDLRQAGELQRRTLRSRGNAAP